jgi:DnaJ-class molecular chaperone
MPDEECGTCHGSGKETVADTANGELGRVGMITCTACGGTGKK